MNPKTYSSVQEAALPWTLESAQPETRRPTFEVVTALLGGRAVLRRELETSLDAHELLDAGLPAQALMHLVDHVGLLQRAEVFERALGISQRTLQRRKNDEPDRPLSAEQSDRTWKFAEILAKATAVFGSQTAAEDWLQRPAIGLNQRTPLELLSTAAGVEAVEDYLTRVEYGVYT